MKAERMSHSLIHSILAGRYDGPLTSWTRRTLGRRGEKNEIQARIWVRDGHNLIRDLQMYRRGREAEGWGQQERPVRTEIAWSTIRNTSLSALYDKLLRPCLS